MNSTAGHPLTRARIPAPHQNRQDPWRSRGVQVAAGARGIAVVEVAEAEVFAAGDSTTSRWPTRSWDPRSGGVWPSWRGGRATVNVDSEIAVSGLSEAATAAGTTMLVQVDIDTGFHRCGVQPDDAEATLPVGYVPTGIKLDGITTHRSAFFPDHGGRPLRRWVKRRARSWWLSPSGSGRPASRSAR